MSSISKRQLLSQLQPKAFAYLWQDSNLIEVPQDSTELQPIIEVVQRSEFVTVSKEQAYSLGFEELATWSQDSDCLIYIESESLLLCIQKSLLNM